ncbi:uncharacterized domain 1-containing protein [Sulfitobacter brevis]|uniref:Uncharacterized domain 1-containing protein n=1 Tax=Sulfitobacter brevis TaxID=74348 RepID=A0A1I1T8H3_9RHOB|nr:PaaI family thioesterase [Sulfitobacter brevis]SFD54886.1 uncharacterized domain 1-containing protein [Sulfitobacter brevis]
MPYPPHEAPQSGAEKLVGYSIDLSDPAGTSAVSLEIAPKHLNRNGTLHGGIHAMMLDAAGGFAASRKLAGEGEIVQVMTLSLATNFVASASEGRVTVTGRVTGGGYKIVYAEAQMVDAEGRILSTAQGVFKRNAT